MLAKLRVQRDPILETRAAVSATVNESQRLLQRSEGADEARRVAYGEIDERLS